MCSLAGKILEDDLDSKGPSGGFHVSGQEGGHANPAGSVSYHGIVTTSAALFFRVAMCQVDESRVDATHLLLLIVLFFLFCFSIFLFLTLSCVLSDFVCCLAWGQQVLTFLGST